MKEKFTIQYNFSINTNFKQFIWIFALQKNYINWASKWRAVKFWQDYKCTLWNLFLFTIFYLFHLPLKIHATLSPMLNYSLGGCCGPKLPFSLAFDGDQSLEFLKGDWRQGRRLLYPQLPSIQCILHTSTEGHGRWSSPDSSSFQVSAAAS